MIGRLLKASKKLFNVIEWRDIEYFDESWRTRIKAMADLIEDESSVLDLGCGKMWLKEYLPPGAEYLGCDYVPRGPGTIVCDFNKRQFPQVTTDLCFVSGCLEYVEDPDWFIAQLSRACDSLILSYCTTDLIPDIASRKSLAWKNHLSRECLVGKIESAGFTLYKKGPDIDGNELMKFKKSGAAGANKAQA